MTSVMLADPRFSSAQQPAFPNLSLLDTFFVGRGGPQWVAKKCLNMLLSCIACWWNTALYCKLLQWMNMELPLLSLGSTVVISMHSLGWCSGIYVVPWGIMLPWSTTYCIIYISNCSVVPQFVTSSNRILNHLTSFTVWTSWHYIVSWPKREMHIMLTARVSYRILCFQVVYYSVGGRHVCTDCGGGAYLESGEYPQ